jgi:hypothetical protein
MEFEWDPGKRAANLLKHGLDFKDVAEIFEGAILTNVDMRKDYGEIRHQCVGKLKSRIVVVVYTKRGNSYRIITMRKANEREKKRIYQKRPETP